MEFIKSCKLGFVFTLAGGLPATAGELPDHNTVTSALQSIVGEQNGGFSLYMWATLVDRDGVVHLVTFSGETRSDQWPGSRVISAQKANTANAFSLPGLALSTANLFSAVQPGAAFLACNIVTPLMFRWPMVEKVKTSAPMMIRWSARKSAA